MYLWKPCGDYMSVITEYIIFVNLVKYFKGTFWIDFVVYTCLMLKGWDWNILFYKQRFFLLSVVRGGWVLSAWYIDASLITL